MGNLSHSLRSSYKDAAYYSLMVGLGETYIAAFVLFAGFGSYHSGLISVLPLTIGSVLQLPFLKFFSPYLSYKRWVTINCVFQTLSLAGLGLLALKGGISLTLLYALVCSYWASGLVAGVGWNSWMSEFLPERLRINFYAKRARVSQLFVFAGIIAAGLLLEFSPAIEDQKKYIFASLFLMAAGFRALSTYHISKQHEAPKTKEEKRWKWDKDFFAYLLKDDIPLLICYAFLLQITVQIAAPFYNPYMLQNLQLRYIEYVVVISCTFVARIVLFPFFRTFAFRFGSARTLFIGTILLALPPALWTVAGDNVLFIILLQFVSGVGWGLQDLGFAVIVVERVKASYRPQAFIVINTLSSLGMFAGSITGGYLLSIGAFSNWSYHLLFAGSTCLRLLVGFMTLLLKGQVRRKHFEIFWRIIGVRPAFGVIMRPILHVAKKNKSGYGQRKFRKEPDGD